jgi:hypothetical protein
MSALSRAFHGSELNGEDNFPGSGGNLNSVYSGAGDLNPQASDEGYAFGNFPTGAMPVGQETQEFRVSDSAAFTGLRGIARTKFPFDPNPTQSNPDQKTTAISDNFQPTDVAGISSMLPGKFSYNRIQGTLGKSILDEFNAGTSTYNSLPDGAGIYSSDNTVTDDVVSTAGSKAMNIVEQHKDAFTNPSEMDVPLTPFHYQYPDFGNGQVDYGYQEPGGEKMSGDIIKAYSAVLPEGQLAGTKKELMPLFSSVSQLAVEQRPMLQSLGKMKNTLYLGGATMLPDELTIDPRQPLMAGTNAPADLVQTSGELASALGHLGFSGADGINTSNPYGQHLPQSATLAGTTPKIQPNFYSYDTSSSEPLTFSTNKYTSNIHSMYEPGMYQ